MTSKYLSVFKISFQQEFAYRLNFVMWRVRNVMQFFLVFFLWDTVFSDPNRVVFGYDRNKILTYVFGILLLRALVLSARAVDVAGEISRGDLTNYLLKPINYFRYWFTRDVSSKALNLGFAIIEASVLFLLLRPPFFIQTNFPILFGFLLSVILAILLFFSILFLVNMIAFWAPSMGWSAQFLVIVIVVEFLSGAIFPIDILPNAIQGILSYLPFPYLLYFPLQIYLGKLTGAAIVKSILIAGAWSAVLLFSVNSVWKAGLKHYAAEGR
ncbi:ABC-2 family transporter protein [Patescibacteria group bacterium]|nr:ABC-2 family transporter protein [Patescibacteria group bacterium]